MATSRLLPIHIVKSRSASSQLNINSTQTTELGTTQLKLVICYLTLENKKNISKVRGSKNCLIAPQNKGSLNFFMCDFLGKPV